jgi:hypothetical protein
MTHKHMNTMQQNSNTGTNVQWTLKLRPAWHTNNLGYDQNFSFDRSLELRLECRSRPKHVSAYVVVNKDPRCVRVRVWAQIRVFVDVISVSAVLYIINFANCYETVLSGRLGTFYNFMVSTLGKLLAFLVNYTHYTTLFYMKRLGKGCFGRFRTHYGHFHYFLWEK